MRRESKLTSHLGAFMVFFDYLKYFFQDTIWEFWRSKLQSWNNKINSNTPSRRGKYIFTLMGYSLNFHVK